MSELSVGQLRGLTVNSNVITVPSGHKLSAPGHILQVVEVTSSTVVTNNSSTYVSTGLSATITPSSTSSKVMVLARTQGISPNNASVPTFTVFRGTLAGTNLAPQTYGFNYLYGGATGAIEGNVAVQIVDSPNTTSAQTYTLAFKNAQGAVGAVSAQGAGTTGSMILMEIAQ
jgi:hypothetical protein